MSDNADDNETYFAALGLTPDATMAQVKARYRELNDAYLKILESSRKGSIRPASQHARAQVEQQPKAGPGQASPSHETDTEPIAVLKEKLASGKIDKAKFQRLAKERYDYLENKPFSELSDSEFDERLKGFEGLKIG